MTEKQTPVAWLEAEHQKVGTITPQQYDKAKDMEVKMVFDFFLWFRDNGEKYLGITIEQLVEKFFKETYINHNTQKSK
jgi:hypothetical protein